MHLQYLELIATTGPLWLAGSALVLMARHFTHCSFPSRHWNWLFLSGILCALSLLINALTPANRDHSFQLWISVTASLTMLHFVLQALRISSFRNLLLIIPAALAGRFLSRDPSVQLQTFAAIFEAVSWLGLLRLLLHERPRLPRSRRFHLDISAGLTLLLLLSCAGAIFGIHSHLQMLLTGGLTTAMAIFLWFSFNPENIQLADEGPLSEMSMKMLAWSIPAGWLMIFGAGFTAIHFWEQPLLTLFRLRGVPEGETLFRAMALSLVFLMQFFYIIGGSLFGMISGAFRENAALRTEQVQQEKTRREMEAKIFHSEKLASIGTLAAGVAHEINNPLAVIQGYTEILRSEGLNPKISEKIFSSVQRISVIVKGLRTFARADTDHIQRLNLSTVTTEAKDLVESIFRKEGIQWEISLHPDAWMLGNIGKLQQVILNLLNNARDALHGRPNPTIQLHCEVVKDQVVLSVRDNGTGIPEHHRRRLFEPFFTNKEPGRGTGLGLSICHSIVQAMNGEIQVESREGEGSTFTLRFRLLTDQGHESAAPLPDRSSAIQLSGHVLVVDDEPELRDILRNVLEKSGLTVDEAPNGKAALQLLTDKPFDFLILDIHMPEMRGDELLLEMEKRGLKSRLRTLVITGGIVTDFGPQQRDHIRRLADGYITKPFSEDAILHQLSLLRPDKKH